MVNTIVFQKMETHLGKPLLILPENIWLGVCIW